MKKIFLYICALSLIMQATAQEQPVVKDGQYYLTKSNNQKTTAWIMLGAGVAMMAGGFIMSENTDDWTDFNGVFVFIAGVPVSLASIPLFISSGNNKAKAAAMAGPGIQPIHLGGSLTRLAPGITIKIQF